MDETIASAAADPVLASTAAEDPVRDDTDSIVAVMKQYPDIATRLLNHAEQDPTLDDVDKVSSFFGQNDVALAFLNVHFGRGPYGNGEPFDVSYRGTEVIRSAHTITGKEYSALQTETGDEFLELSKLDLGIETQIGREQRSRYDALKKADPSGKWMYNHLEANEGHPFHEMISRGMKSMSEAASHMANDLHLFDRALSEFYDSDKPWDRDVYHLFTRQIVPSAGETSDEANAKDDDGSESEDLAGQPFGAQIAEPDHDTLFA